MGMAVVVMMMVNEILSLLTKVRSTKNKNKCKTN